MGLTLSLLSWNALNYIKTYYFPLTALKNDGLVIKQYFCQLESL
jgi:hypothetical protein